MSFSYIIIGFQCIYVCAIEISDYITIKFESIKRHGEKSVMDYPGPTLGVFFFTTMSIEEGSGREERETSLMFCCVSTV